MFIERLIRRPIEAALFQGKTLVLFGPRQVGKTTLVKRILAGRKEPSAYVSCDLPEVRSLLQNPSMNSRASWASAAIPWNATLIC